MDAFVCSFFISDTVDAADNQMMYKLDYLQQILRLSLFRRKRKDVLHVSMCEACMKLNDQDHNDEWLIISTTTPLCD